MIVRRVLRRHVPRFVKAPVRKALWVLGAAAAPDVRTWLALRYLRGDGIEIGALHGALPVSRAARVRYVDRLTVDGLRAQYPELRDVSLVTPDIVDDGEVLDSIPDGSLDFVAASHFVEHCENPIGTLRNHLQKLRPDGVLFLVVPDKRATFDAGRAVTTIAHLVRDDREGPDWSRRAHYDEWVQEANDVDRSEADATAERLLAERYSIHFHVWTPEAFLELLRFCREELGLPLELLAFERSDAEFVVVLQKVG
jgi:SAM-dependent methyltransferase